MFWYHVQTPSAPVLDINNDAHLNKVVFFCKGAQTFLYRKKP